MPTPETTAYLILGLVAVAVIMFAFIGSLILRFRSAQKDVELMHELYEE